MGKYDKIIFDSTNPEDISQKVASEKETRSKFLTVASWAGREKDMLILFHKYDKLMKYENNEEKRKDLSKIGAIEVYKLLGDIYASLRASGALNIAGLDSHRGELWVDGEMVYKDRG